ncbi:Petrobactin ABC transporter, periplasmic binding protein, partial [uncultured Gammaproteobacteria bacterium]
MVDLSRVILGFIIINQFVVWFLRVDYLTDDENTKIIEIVQQITKKYEDANFKVHLAGSALFAGVIKQAMKKDTRRFIQKMLLMVILVLALMMVILVLALMFRRVSGVVLPLITVAL